MSLSKEKVLHIAKLAALEIPEEELEQANSELSKILTYVESLQAISTAGVPITSHVHGIQNVFREDLPQPSLTREAAQSMAPSADEQGFRVPKIIS